MMPINETSYSTNFFKEKMDLDSYKQKPIEVINNNSFGKLENFESLFAKNITYSQLITDSVEKNKEIQKIIQEKQKINGVIYENEKAITTFYEDGSIGLSNSFSTKLNSDRISELGLNEKNISTQKKISLVLQEYDLNGSDVSIYNFEKNQNGPLIRDSLMVSTEDGLKKFLKISLEHSTLPNPGLGGRLAGFTGIEVMERSQMLDRVKTAG